jgi:hypothetical protein
VDRFRKVSDDLGIQSIGLRQAAGGFGEVAYLARIDHHDWQTRRCQGTGRFAHYQRWSLPSEELSELPDAFRSIRVLMSGARWTHH